MIDILNNANKIRTYHDVMFTYSKTAGKTMHRTVHLSANLFAVKGITLFILLYTITEITTQVSIENGCTCCQARTLVVGRTKDVHILNKRRSRLEKIVLLTYSWGCKKNHHPP